MASSANNISLDLLELYKSAEVNRITTFCDVAAQLDPANLATAYARARDSAPRRHDSNKRYFVDHSGQTNRSENSNRGEEHLALALWGALQSGSPMVLPTGEALEIVDYQTPLKARQSDKGVGKIDLFGIIDNRRLTVIELKVLPTTTGRGDSPLRAYLEGLAYCAIVEANVSEIASEASTKFGKSVDERPPGLVVMAPQDFWAGYLEHGKTGQWWPALSSLAMEIDKILGIETHFLALQNATFQMGTMGVDPCLTGDCSVVGVAELVDK